MTMYRWSLCKSHTLLCHDPADSEGRGDALLYMTWSADFLDLESRCISRALWNESIERAVETSDQAAIVIKAQLERRHIIDIHERLLSLC